MSSNYRGKNFRPDYRPPSGWHTVDTANRSHRVRYNHNSPGRSPPQSSYDEGEIFSQDEPPPARRDSHHDTHDESRRSSHHSSHNGGDGRRLRKYSDDHEMEDRDRRDRRGYHPGPTGANREPVLSAHTAPSRSDYDVDAGYESSEYRREGRRSTHRPSSRHDSRHGSRHGSRHESYPVTPITPKTPRYPETLPPNPELAKEIATLLGDFTSQVANMALLTVQHELTRRECEQRREQNGKHVALEAEVAAVAEQQSRSDARLLGDFDALDKKLKEHVQAREAFSLTLATKLAASAHAPSVSDESRVKSLEADIRDLRRAETDNQKELRHLQTASGGKSTEVELQELRRLEVENREEIRQLKHHAIKNAVVVQPKAPDPPPPPPSAPPPPPIGPSDHPAKIDELFERSRQLRANAEGMTKFLKVLDSKVNEQFKTSAATAKTVGTCSIEVNKIQSEHRNIKTRLLKAEEMVHAMQNFSDRFYAVKSRVDEFPDMRMEMTKLRDEIKGLRTYVADNVRAMERRARQASPAKQPAPPRQAPSPPDDDLVRSVQTLEQSTEAFRAALQKVDDDLETFDQDMGRFEERLVVVESNVSGGADKVESVEHAMTDFRAEQEARDQLVVEEIEQAKTLAVELQGAVASMRKDLADSIVAKHWEPTNTVPPSATSPTTPTRGRGRGGRPRGSRAGRPHGSSREPPSPHLRSPSTPQSPPSADLLALHQRLDQDRSLIQALDARVDHLADRVEAHAFDLRTLQKERVPAEKVDELATEQARVATELGEVRAGVDANMGDTTSQLRRLEFLIVQLGKSAERNGVGIGCRVGGEPDETEGERDNSREKTSEADLVSSGTRSHSQTKSGEGAGTTLAGGSSERPKKKRKRDGVAPGESCAPS